MLMDQIDQMDQMDKIGAPVFALTGYAAASHVIPRGLALPQCGLAWAKRCLSGMQGNLMAVVVCCLRGRDACKTVVNGG